MTAAPASSWSSEVFAPLVDAGILETVTTFLANGGSIEATARAMFVHPNTVRYRLRRAGEVTGLSPNDARHAYTYRIALTLGRLQAPEHPRNNRFVGTLQDSTGKSSSASQARHGPASRAE